MVAPPSHGNLKGPRESATPTAINFDGAAKARATEPPWAGFAVDANLDREEITRRTELGLAGRSHPTQT